MAGLSDYKQFSGMIQHQYPEQEQGGYNYPPPRTSNVPPYTYSAEDLGFMRDQEQQAAGARIAAFSPPSSHHVYGDFRDLSLNFNQDLAKSRDSSPEDPSVHKFADKGAGLISLFADNILSHPFLVLRRQCQVHVQAKRYHISPFTLVSPLWNICQRQGCGVLWKGLGSSLLVRGMTMFVEDLTSKVSSLPNEITRHSTMKSVSQHLLLKTISLAVITPFYSASVVETAQSEVVMESAGLLDVFREGLWRVLTWPNTGRLVPLHVLVPPTITYGLLSYLIYTGIKSVSLSTIRRVRESKERKQGALSKDSNVTYHAEMTASLIGHATADILLFPLETILHRLHLQGTRTIIDSLDCGTEVTPVITGYEGVLHCFRTTIEEEGFSGLYKGFGALILQYGLQILLIRVVKIVLEKNPWGNPHSAALPCRSASTIHPIGMAQTDTGSITPITNARPVSRQYSRSFTPNAMMQVPGDDSAIERRRRY